MATIFNRMILIFYDLSAYRFRNNVKNPFIFT